MSSQTDAHASAQDAAPWMASAVPIGDYGFVGDTRTAALVAPNGSIDWMCAPRFDGEPIFGRLIGGTAAGSFVLGPAESDSSHPADRAYAPETATLVTTWASRRGVLTLTEGMVAEIKGRLLPTTLLVRRLTAADEPADAVLTFDPRLGDRHARPRWRRGVNGLTCSWGSVAAWLGNSAGIEIVPGQSHRITVYPDQPVTLAFGLAFREPLIYVDTDHAWDALIEDEERWRAWSNEVANDLPSRDAVVRSLITLRLLTYSPAGAPVASPTTSLPEENGGVRNWDYRFAWPRDASIGVGAFLGTGKPDEAKRFLEWLLHATRLDRPRLPTLLTLHGRHSPKERELEDWPGYAASTPVRMGNGASTQHQLDGYGWVLDAAWLLTDSGHRLSSEAWRAMRGFADTVVELWRQPDAGIWELRGDGAHHVHSKLMAWLAVDRALRIAATRKTRVKQRRRWASARDAIAREVREKGFDDARQTYTATYGSSDLDAALLILPLLDLHPPTAPEVRGTIDAVRRELDAGRPLLYRYPPGSDGLEGSEGAFLPCSFWLVQALAKVGRREEASVLFTELLDLSGPLGLLSEEMDPGHRSMLGNFPQALTHAALIQAALALREAAQ